MVDRTIEFAVLFLIGLTTAVTVSNKLISVLIGVLLVVLLPGLITMMLWEIKRK